MWNSRNSRKILQDRVEKNWKINKYKIKMKDFNLEPFGTIPIILASSLSYFVIGFEEHNTLLLIDMFRNEIIPICATIFYAKKRVVINDELLAICTDSRNIYGEAISTTMQIFSTKSQTLLIQEEKENFISFSTDSFAKTSDIILFGSQLLVTL